MELKKKLATSEKITQMSLELEVTRSLWSNGVNISRLDGNRDAVAMHVREITDAIIADPKRLHDATQLDGEQFGAALERLTKHLLSLEDALLFLEDDNGRSGNRCKLTRQGALFWVICMTKNKITQKGVGMVCGIDQSTVSRYVKLIKPWLKSILPNTLKMSKMVRNAKTAEEKEIILPGRNGGDLFLDGTHVRIQRPEDCELRKSTYSGKKKYHTGNVEIITNRDGLILHTSVGEGSTHDITMVRNNYPVLGTY